MNVQVHMSVQLKMRVVSMNRSDHIILKSSFVKIFSMFFENTAVFLIR